ncbi:MULTISPECIES: hypothetical protein [Sphingobacterium]|uniref:Uncharacterized protein n=1 Tax=Sphingobacterium multivorum TaxID=28454 RepID=A0A654CV30_SPHMU|nr:MULTISPECIES: hypothetical protein [Sphingobacterium]OJZ15156.1 MAG: hypothetical protein BGP15_23830 [Sphingobacterium sp. 40-24]QQT44596.1 hypothetical protein I6J00_23255 [Sphingobacterium multivorum]SUJ87849.1 Uncharacterised protein [Sphingobacterium multivorum]VXC94625.1 conserved hypothetical protein [Sphingobacterium multivorum]
MQDFEYIKTVPDERLSGFVESFLLCANHTDEDKGVIIFPDGRVDIMFSCTDQEPLVAELFNLDKKASRYIFKTQTKLFMVCLILLGAEYRLGYNGTDFGKDEIRLPADLWDISKEDLTSLDSFAEKVSEKLLEIFPKKMDEKKQQLFELIYSSGSKALSSTLLTARKTQMAKIAFGTNFLMTQPKNTP